MTAVIIIVAVAVVLLLIIGLFLVYNNLITIRTSYKSSYLQIGGLLQKRHDLILSLIDTVREYLPQEHYTLETVTQARERAVQANKAASTNPGEAWALQGVSGAEDALAATLVKLYAIVETYPGGQHMLLTQKEIFALDDKVLSAQKSYNEKVKAFNTGLQGSPGKYLAKMASLSPAAPYTAGQDNPMATKVKA